VRLSDSEHRAVLIVHLSHVVSEIEFAQILIKVLFADVVIYPIDATFENRKIALDRVRRNRQTVFVPRVFFLRVVDLRVLPAVCFKAHLVRRIRHDVRALLDKFIQCWPKALAGYPLGRVIGADIAASLEQCNYLGFFGARVLAAQQRVHAFAFAIKLGRKFLFAADIGFIDFDYA
jgi:hypothetical protein